MDAAPQPLPYRRIGTILVDRGLISADQLAVGLEEQQRTGRPLGEICVDRFKLDRLSLADALAEQWEEMKAASLDPLDDDGVEPDADALGDSPEEDLRVLLEEAQAARAELTVKTDELSKRLAALETLVSGVRDALVELRPAAARNGGNGSTRTQGRAGARASH